MEKGLRQPSDFVELVVRQKGRGGQYFLIEVKADNQIDAPVVIAKRDYAEKMAAASNMTYFLLKASDAENGRYQMMWSKEGRDTYLDTISQTTIGLLG